MPSAKVFSFKPTIAVARHELRVLLYSPVTYLFQAGFLVVLGLCVFQVADFYATDDVSMRLWILFFPWIGLVFVPTLAMQAWPSEYVGKSAELSLTLPVSSAALVGGKYFSGIAVLLITMMFGIAFPLTLGYLGEPDWGVVIAGLLAAFLVLALYFSVALCIAFFVGDAILVFVVSVVTLFFLILFGTTELETLLGPVLPGYILQAAYSLSPQPHFKSIATGLVKASDISYFFFFIFFLFMLCSVAITARRHGRLSSIFNGKRWFRVGIFLLVAALLQTVFKTFPVEMDLTEHREFTISAATVKQISQIQEEVRLDFFWSEQQTSIPASIRSHANRVHNLLKRIQHHSRGNVVLTHFDPVPDTNFELTALESGMRVIPMTSGDYFYLGLVITHKDRTHTLPYIEIERERFLEYDLLSALNRILNPAVNKIALLSPLLPPSVLENPRPGLFFVEELKRRNDVVLVPFFAEQLPDQTDVLIILQGAVLKGSMLYAIDQYIMNGGTLIALLDPNVRSDEVGNEIRFQPSAEINDLSDLLLSYGVRYIGDKIVGDVQLASPVSLGAGGANISHPYWMRFNKDHISADHPVVGGLNDLLLVEAGSLEIINNRVVQPLLKTTEKSGIHLRKNYQDRDVRELATDLKITGTEHIVAALIEGNLVSAYTDLDIGRKPEHLKAAQNARVFVIADSDWLFDSFALQTASFEGEVTTKPINDNLAFLENMIAYGAGSNLGNIPTRGRLSRPFTRVARLFKNVEQTVKTNERSTLENVMVLEANLVEIRRASGVEVFSELPSPLREQALSLQKQLVAMRRDLRNIRSQIRERIDSLGTTLAALNIAGGPLAVLVFGVSVAFYRRTSGRNDWKFRDTRDTQFSTGKKIR